jgi:hypothetical protein
MLKYCVRALMAALVIYVAGAVVVAQSASALSERRDGGVDIGGRTLRCSNARIKFDQRLPNLGISIPDSRLLVLNPALLRRQPETVRVFVFHHECGHHHVGGSELGADCWAVNRGVMDGWLDKTSLTQVCRSFGNAPRTATHPAGATRCANLDRCFATASATLARQKRLAVGTGAPAASSSPAPQLVSGPRLIRTGVLR